jgi:hypothetical protein
MPLVPVIVDEELLSLSFSFRFSYSSSAIRFLKTAGSFMFISLWRKLAEEIEELRAWEVDIIGGWRLLAPPPTFIYEPRLPKPPIEEEGWLNELEATCWMLPEGPPPPILKPPKLEASALEPPLMPKYDSKTFFNVPWLPSIFASYGFWLTIGFPNK